MSFDVTAALWAYAIVSSLYAGPVGLLSIKPAFNDHDKLAFIVACGLAFSWLGAVIAVVVMAVTS